ncbi:MAG: 3-phosphoshikimate 1-carboxyvinyltransferase [Niabella sp.]
MNITIQPSFLKGSILAPASKSFMQRACAAALVAAGQSVVYNPGHSNDDKAAMGIIEALGATIEKGDEEISIDSEAFKDFISSSCLEDETTIHCGESGLSIRMFTPLAALCARKVTITGEGSLATRPMHVFDEILPQLGVKVSSNEGKLPLVIQGPMQIKDIEIDGSLSSQFLTGLLMAFAAAPESYYTADVVTIKVNDLKSRPYIDLTLDVIQQFGLRVPENRDYESFVFYKTKSGTNTHTLSYTVEGDWSGGAFLLVAGAIAGDVRVRGLSLLSTQADRRVMEALTAANATFAQDGKGIVVRAGKLKAFQFDATDCPDLFPPLVALAAYGEGDSVIKGVSRLAHKESNRGLTLQEEFGKMGVEIKLEGDEMTVRGGGNLRGTTVHSRHDHRIAMACAVAALKASGPVVIGEAGAIDKSYPDFYRDLKSLGATVEGLFDWEKIF